MVLLEIQSKTLISSRRLIIISHSKLCSESAVKQLKQEQVKNNIFSQLLGILREIVETKQTRNEYMLD